MADKIKLVLGTMTIGEQIFGDDATEMLKTFHDAGGVELDTAYIYNNGTCEQILGDSLAVLGSDNFKIATKVNPRITGTLKKEDVINQLTESLSRLKVDKVDTLYLHFPDPNTPLEDTLEGCAELYNEGKYARLGLSNFPAWQVAEIYNICKRHGWMLPKVYEGVYNALSRKVESELDKALDYYGMSFYAYNPLAGGLLTDKYAPGKREVIPGRFTNRPNYQKRYWKDSYFEAIDEIRDCCKKYNITIIEAAYRWLGYHSMMKPDRGDAILIGASKVNHLMQNMALLDEGPLPEDVVASIDAAWEISKADAPEYFRFTTSGK